MPISAAMQTHLNGTTSLAVFLKLTARDGSILRVCNCTRNKILGGEIYFAFPVAPSQLQATNGLRADNLEVTAIYSGLFTAATLRANKWLGARVEYRVMNYKDFTMDYAMRRVGFIGKTEIGKLGAKPELKSLSQKLTETVGGTYLEDCDAELSDARCKVNLNGNTVTGYRIRINAHVVAPVSNRQQFAVAFDQTIKPGDAGATIAPDNFYHQGKFKFTSGNNNTVEGQILANDGNALTLLVPVFYQVQIGDTLQLTAGCNKKIAMCRDLYNNAPNNRSFYCLPGRSKIFKAVD